MKMIVAIIQARMGSTRLPGKVRRLIGERTMLARVIERTQQIPGVEMVVVATTKEDADLWILDESARCGVPAYRGPEEDVLARYETVANVLALAADDLIVRITADCPLLDPVVSGQVLQLAITKMVDYASNLRDWPDGLDTEVFTRRALSDAYHMTGNPEDREHVTPWMRRNLFCLELPHDPNLRHVKFSVDTEDELEYAHELSLILGVSFGWQDILRADPGVICEGCRMGAPRRLRSVGRMVVEESEKSQAEVLWDLHEIPCSGGVRIQGCEAWEVARRAAEVEIPAWTICSRSLDGGLLRSPSDAPVSHPVGLSDGPPLDGSLPGA